ncbi:MULTISPECIES: helix-turn-helix domain-containing protein [unclassified Brevibacterium]|uniref:helix-turn-helix domain-containing protein n=1 Tax=unclassified Brevibacterium TaxID=2614124 RepID=UPI0010810D87|nr:helix-turn-helix domain-containing protein [Brevibacterium sp. S111]TGD13051.1 DNA-binding protein [Brevibacterium sp. S111]
MSALASSERIAISDQTVKDAQDTVIPSEASLVLRFAGGEEAELPASIQRTLLHALKLIAQQGSVSIGQLPTELTSTVAADLLSISRPTLMKWVGEGRISSFKKGSHTRFSRDEVLDLRERNVAARRSAFDELRQLDEEHEEFLTD